MIKKIDQIDQDAQYIGNDLAIQTLSRLLIRF
jgi:hypothetical protein